MSFSVVGSETSGPAARCEKRDPYCLVPLEQHHSPTFVSSGQIVARVVELDGRDDIR